MISSSCLVSKKRVAALVLWNFALNLSSWKMPPKSSSRKIRKCHNDFRGMICVCCLAKIKAKWPKKVNESISSLIESHVYPNYQSHKEYLPTAICTKCRDLVNAQSELEIFPLVKYKELIENVKECQINANFGENAICLYELSLWVMNIHFRVYFE